MASLAMKLLIICWTGCTVTLAAKWSYEGKTGPLYWHKLFPEGCAGLHQSPIDIRAEETMYNPDLKDFAIWYDPPKPDSKMYIKNNGHTVQVDLEGEFYVTNAGLPHVYKAAQFHFHWGHKVHYGSEHTMEGKPSPIELHLVTYNKDVYSHIGEAVTKKGGLAVLGVMFEVSKEDNPVLDDIVKALKHIKDPENRQSIDLPLVSLRDLMPDDISKYYRYNGSLTTPGCFESVTWSVFDMKQTISHKQLRQFRTLLQFRRHHKKHDSHDRHKRSAMSDAEKRAEHNAEKVITELGIEDDQFEKDVLEASLLEKKEEELMADQSQNSHHRTSNEPGHHHKPSNSSDLKSEDIMVPTEPVKLEYIQDIIVNNYRPVQKLNGRIVQRSFKLRQPPIVVEVVQKDQNEDRALGTRRGGYRNYDGQGGSGNAENVCCSAFAVFFSLLVCAVFGSRSS